MGNHDHGRPGAPLRTVSLRLLTMGWLKAYSEFAQDRRAWGASVRNVANLIGDATSIEQVKKY